MYRTLLFTNTSDANIIAVKHVDIDILNWSQDIFVFFPTHIICR